MKIIMIKYIFLSFNKLQSEWGDDQVLLYNYAVILHLSGKNLRAMYILYDLVFENNEYESKNEYLIWKIQLFLLVIFLFLSMRN
jgi:hypothetical protein